MNAEVATYYDILKVSRKARPDGVRAAYRTLAQKYHPDKMPDNPDAQRVMAAINEAYAVLSDPLQRARYDQCIGPSGSRPQLVARLDDPGEAWPWYLLFATITIACAAVGVSFYKSFVPGASAGAASAAHAAVAQRPTGLVTSPRP